MRDGLLDSEGGDFQVSVTGQRCLDELLQRGVGEIVTPAEPRGRAPIGVRGFCCWSVGILRGNGRGGPLLGYERSGAAGGDQRGEKKKCKTAETLRLHRALHAPRGGRTYGRRRKHNVHAEPPGGSAGDSGAGWRLPLKMLRITTKKTGTKTSASIVPVTMPPSTPVPIAR